VETRAEQVTDVNVIAAELLPTPEEVKQKLPLSDRARETVLTGRRAVNDILDRKDPRLIVVVGPCSIHELESAREYVVRLKKLSDELSDSLVILMRVYFAKPRTTVGWKGFINDPNLDDSFQIDKGLEKAREFLIEIGDAGMPVGTEALDPITPQFLDDVISWNAIGARTAESQTHREMASGLSTPVGFKNGTDGNIQVGINALSTMRKPHHFLGINQQGQLVVLRTRGNNYGHIVLRGGVRPNYDSVSISLCEKELAGAGLPVNIMVDCSHGNSLKDHTLQPLVLDNCITQILEGNRSIIGVMLESNLREGNQKITDDFSKLEYGVSITDACIGWETTETLLRQAHERLGPVLKRRQG
jgi:3-deoxy-7-phosphoheptulonate synthase